MRAHDNLKAAILMIATMACFALNDACIKALADRVPLFQSVVIRGIGASLLLAILCYVMGQMRWRYDAHDRVWIFLRGLTEMAAGLFFLTALYHMPLTNASAILQVVPLTVALAAWIFLGESLDRRGMIAIAIGFVGVLLLLHPGGEGFNIFGLSALAAVASITLRDLASRKLSDQVPSLMVALISSIMVTLGFAVGLFFTDWVTLAPYDGAVLSVSVVTILLAYLFSVMMMRVGNISAVAPLRYSGLVFSLMIGIIAFGERPDGLTWLGAAVIVLAGLYTLAHDGARRADAVDSGDDSR